MEEIGRNIIRLESVDSTNNYTANRVRANDLRHGAVILAVEQTGGRGQMGASWQSDSGMNLTFSVFLDNVNLSPDRQFFLTKIVSLSIVDFLARYGVEAKVKWPNDIYVGNLKIAGVLIENFLMGQNVNKSILGIGLNVNQKVFSGLNATSLKLETGTHYSIDELLFSFIGQFNEYLNSKDDQDIHDQYLRKLYRYEEQHQYEDANGTFVGTISGIDSLGKLIVEREGFASTYSLKEIKFL